MKNSRGDHLNKLTPIGRAEIGSREVAYTTILFALMIVKILSPHHVSVLFPDTDKVDTVSVRFLTRCPNQNLLNHDESVENTSETSFSNHTGESESDRNLLTNEFDLFSTIVDSAEDSIQPDENVSPSKDNDTNQNIEVENEERSRDKRKRSIPAHLKDFELS